MGRPDLAEIEACSAIWVVRHESWQVTSGVDVPRMVCSNAPISIA